MKHIFVAVAVVMLALAGALPLRPMSSLARQATETSCVVDEGTPAPITSSQRIIGQSEVTGLPEGPATITTLQITLAPGSETQPFTNPGPVLIVVQDGVVTLNADSATIGAPPEAVTGIPIATQEPQAIEAEDVIVNDDEQIEIPSGATVQLGNGTDERVRLLVISITPGAATAFQEAAQV